jgi:hypothetical protein
MKPHSKIRVLWLGLAVLLVAIAVPLAGPMRVAWQCYWLHENGIREQSEVLHKLERETLVLHIVEGPHAGETCTADTSPALFAATAVGDRAEVVYVDWKPGECELSSTIEASALLLWVISGGVALLVSLVVAFGIFVTRGLTRVGVPARRIAADPADVCCPACGKCMDEGYLPLVAGIHWRGPGQAIGLPHALGGLPGTVGWRGRPLRHAFRCVPCEIVTFQYGHPRSG